MIKIDYIRSFKDNYIWVLLDPEDDQIAVIDPGQATPVIDYITNNNLALDSILLTHHHFDHTGGVEELVEIYQPKVFGPKNENIPNLNFYLSENDIIKLENVGNIEFKIIDTPAHTKGHISYYGNNMLFCGDTLFSSGCGRLFEGTAEEMLDSLEKLAKLPQNTKVYPAHEYTKNNLSFAQTVEPSNIEIQEKLKYIENLLQKNKPSLPSTIEIELKTNPFLRCNMPEIITSASNYSKKDIKSKLDVFAAIRIWKDNF